MDTNTKNAKQGKRQYSYRWGIPTDTNFTIVYETFLRHYHQVQWITDDGQCGRGIANTDMMVLIHLSQFKFESPNSIASPALDTIAIRMGMTQRNLIYHIQCLERKNLLGVHRRRGRSSVYDLTPFARSIQSLAASDGSNNFHPTRDNDCTAPVKNFSSEKENTDDIFDTAWNRLFTNTDQGLKGALRRDYTRCLPSLVTLLQQYAAARADGTLTHLTDPMIYNRIRCGDPPPVPQRDNDLQQAVAASQTTWNEDREAREVVDIDPLQDVWAETLVMLSRQMTRATFNTHLSGITLTADGDGYTMQCPTNASREWLEYRLRDQVTRVFTSTLQLHGLIDGDEQPQVRFAVRGYDSDPSGSDTGDTLTPPDAVAVPVR